VKATRVICKRLKQATDEMVNNFKQIQHKEMGQQQENHDHKCGF
jgi:hypothetical protein